MKSPSWSFWCIRWNKNPLTLWSSNLCLTSTILLGPNGGGKLIHLKVETVRPYPTVHVKFGKSSTQVGSQVTRRLYLSYPRGIRCGSFLGNKRVTKIKLFWWGIITAFRDVQSGAFHISVTEYKMVQIQSMIHVQVTVISDQLRYFHQERKSVKGEPS